MKPTVIFGVPSLSYSVSLEHHKSAIETEWELGTKNIAHGFIQRGGDQFVAKVRNKIVTEFLLGYPQATHLFFLDDDIGWPATKVTEFIKRDMDVLAGIYPKRDDQLDFPVELIADSETGELIEKDGLFQARGVATGFLCIKRHVLQTLADKARTFKDIEADGKTKNFYGIFESGIGPDGWWWGEDWTFCQKWQETGGKIWVDPNIEFTHRGGKKWKESLSNHIETFRTKGRDAAMKNKEAA